MPVPEPVWRAKAQASGFKGDNGNPYVQEHVDLFNAIESGEHVNEARQVAESTLTAIMGRMSAYTGQEVTWEQSRQIPGLI